MSERLTEPVTLHYSEALLLRAVHAFWWRETGWSFVGALAAMCASVAIMVCSGNRSWWVGALGALLVCAALVSATVYLTHRRASLARFRRMREPEATLELGPERFRIASELGTSEVRWDAVAGVCRFPEFWLLYFSRAEFITLPTADLPDEARKIILEKVKTLKA